jgi:hypothetical protein
MDGMRSRRFLSLAVLLQYAERREARIIRMLALELRSQSFRSLIAEGILIPEAQTMQQRKLPGLTSKFAMLFDPHRPGNQSSSAFDGK